MSEATSVEPSAAATYDVFPADEAPAPVAVQPEAPEAEAPETPADDPSAADDAEAQKPKRDPQERINKAIRAQREAEREAQFLREQLQRVQTPQQQQPAAPEGAQLPPDLAHAVGAAPNPADFPAGEYDPNFIRAQVRHDMRADQAQQVMQQRQAQQRNAAQQFQQRIASINDAGGAAYADFVEVAHSVPMPQHVVGVLAECDAPHEVAYFLGKNPKEAARIAALSPIAVARELTKIEAKLTKIEAPAPSNAPAPPPTLRARGTLPASIYAIGDDVTPEQYKRMRQGK